MKVWSPLLKHVVYPCVAGSGYLRGSRRAPGICVVTYHGVLPDGYKSIDPDLDGAMVSRETLRRQLRLLKTHFQVISPAEFRSWCQSRNPLPPRSVLLTCDDGLLNTVTEMLPVLQDEGMQCFFFLTGASCADQPSMLWHDELYVMLRSTSSEHASGLLPAISGWSKPTSTGDRRSLWWSLVKSLSQYEPSARAEFLERARVRLRLPEDWKPQLLAEAPLQRRFLSLTATQVHQLLEAGMMVGAHSMTHPVLSHVPEPLAWKEIAEIRLALERVTGAPTWAVAYPFGNPGSVSERESAMAERAGYECAFLNAGGRFSESISLFAVPRVHVTGKMSLAEFEAHISGFHDVLRRRFTRPEVPLAAIGS
jgi:peptidoglycan/xylan/chitin deacetylase (PgdA/CDA1 family)